MVDFQGHPCQCLGGGMSCWGSNSELFHNKHDLLAPGLVMIAFGPQPGELWSCFWLWHWDLLLAVLRNHTMLNLNPGLPHQRLCPTQKVMSYHSCCHNHSSEYQSTELLNISTDTWAWREAALHGKSAAWCACVHTDLEP